MLKIMATLVFAFAVSASANFVIAADVTQQKVAGATIQKIDSATQKNVHTQINSVSAQGQEKPMKKISDAESTSKKAQIGLLLTALFCFIALSNRRGV